MKKFFKWLGIILCALLLIITGVVLYIYFSDLPSYDVAVRDVHVQSTPERVERGRKLASVLCMECHKNPETQLLTGNEMVDVPKEFGRVFSKNITQHPEKGIGKWSDGEIVWLLRTGIHPKTGQYVPPWMPKFLKMSDEDLYSIISFLRSDDPMLKPTAVDNRASETTLLVKILCRTVFTPLDYPSGPIAGPDTNNAVEHGRYLANSVLDCYACHSGDFKTMDIHNPEKSGDYYAGGNEMLDVNGAMIPTVNITPDKETGIGSWTQEQFVNSLKSGFRPNGTLLKFPMGRFHHLSDKEIEHIYAFLKTVPPIKKVNKQAQKVELSPSATVGEKKYVEYGCVHCHGATGLAYANLQLANTKYQTDSVLADVINNPTMYLGEKTNMPTWNGRIAEQDMKEIIAHVRGLCKKAGK